MKKDVTTTSMEMLTPNHFRQKLLDRKDVRVIKVENPTPALNHFFFS